MFSLLKRENKKVRLVYVTHGALGDMLMAFHLLSLADDPAVVSKTVLIRKNVGLAKQLAGLYGNAIAVQVLSPRYLFSLSFFGTYSIFGPSFSKFIHKMSLIISLIAVRGGKPILFSYKKNIRPLERALAHQIIPFDKEKLFIENIFSAIKPYTTKRDPYPVALPHNAAQEKERRIIVHPFAASPKRSFPIARWKALLGEMSKAFPEHEILITMFGKEIEQKSFLEGLPNMRFLENASIAELKSYFDRSTVFLGVDTGTTHLAAMSGIETICIASRSNPTWYPTYAPKARVLTNEKNCTCRGDKTGNCIVTVGGQAYYRCMMEVPDGDIIQAIAAAL